MSRSGQCDQGENCDAEVAQPRMLVDCRARRNGKIGSLGGSRGCEGNVKPRLPSAASLSTAENIPHPLHDFPIDLLTQGIRSVYLR